MLTTLLGAAFAGYDLAYVIKVVIIVAALIAIMLIALRAMGISLPPWAIQIFWVVVIAVVAILAVSILLSL